MDEHVKKLLALKVKHSGGSVMVWTHFSSRSPGNLVGTKDTLNDLRASARKTKK